MFTKQEECGNVTVGSESLIASEPVGGRCRHQVSTETRAGLRCSVDSQGEAHGRFALDERFSGL